MGIRPQPAVLAAALGLVLLAGTAPAQRIGEAKGFKLAQTEEGRTRFLLEAGRGVPLDGGRQILLSDMTLQTFGKTNNAELRILAPECLYDTAGQWASSPGALRVETPDGKFSIAGEGFLWRQTNSSLFISNRVHTVVQPDLLAGAGDRPREESAASPDAGVHIFADRFDYEAESGLGNYRETVRMSGTNLSLTGSALVIRLPLNARQIQSIAASGDVVADYSAVHVTGQTGVYSAETGILEMSGQPAWRADMREGKGDQLIIDRTNRIFKANGNAWLKMPRQSLGETGFFSGSEPGSAAIATNEFVEVFCQSYELRTNWGVFREPVQLRQKRGEAVVGDLVCREMTLTFQATNQLDTLVARDGVVIQQATNRFTGANAVFATTNGVLDLTGNPAWASGRRQGKGDLLRVEARQDRLLVRGNASMRVPAEELSQTQGLPAPSTAPNTPAQELFADIFSSEYTLEKGGAEFSGGVHIVHPQMDLVCRRLTAQLTPAEGDDRRIVAEEAVTFDLKDDRNQSVHGTGERVIYDFGSAGVSTNDILRLTGSPARLVTTNGVVESRMIILDRASNKLSAPPGDWRIHGQAPRSGTNVLALPTSSNR